jgi:hypothetical protein
MINLEIFLTGLLIVSAFTGLVTEAVKMILAELKTKIYANTLAGIVAAVLSVALGAGYVIITGLAFTLQTVVCIIALAFLSWLCAMVGYDKIIQVIANLKTNKRG